MSLVIRKMRTHCRAPRRFERPGALVEDVARGPLASELKAQLGPSLDRLPAVVRLKQLRVRLEIPARNLNTMTLADAWARALTLALHRALASPAGDGATDSRRYQSDAAYQASLLHHIATKGVAPSWEFPELEDWHGCSPAEAALRTLLRNPRMTIEILEHLDRQGWLELLLASWDELSLERLMQALASDDLRIAALSIEDLVELGRAAAAPGGMRPQWSFASRRQAIRLWVGSHQRWPLRAVWHGLRLLLRFLELPALLILRDPSLLADSIPFPPWCEDIVRAGAIPEEFPNDKIIFPGATSGSLTSSERKPGPSAPRTIPFSLASVLGALRPLVPSAAAAPAAGRCAAATWIVSDCAGLLLMLSVVRRLNLWRLIRTPEFASFGGPRAFSFFLAGVGMNLLGRWKSSAPIEPVAALFAGMFGETDLAGMRQFLRESDVTALADFVEAATWDEALDRAATEFARTFASRVRGFRQASRESIVKQFVRVRGRVLVERWRLVVVLHPSPWAVALRLSGMDEALERVEWLDERRVEFVLEGL